MFSWLHRTPQSDWLNFFFSQPLFFLGKMVQFAWPFFLVILPSFYLVKHIHIWELPSKGVLLYALELLHLSKLGSNAFTKDNANGVVERMKNRVFLDLKCYISLQHVFRHINWSFMSDCGFFCGRIHIITL